MRSIRATKNPAEMIRIVTELRNRLPQLRDDALFVSSIPQFLSLAGYKFVVAEDSRSDEPCAFGLLTFYKVPMAERLVLVVEAMWFRDDSVEDQLWVWNDLASYAQRLELAALCVAEKSVNTPLTLRGLVKCGGFADRCGGAYAVQTGNPLLQGTVPGLYSAFTEGPLSGSVFDTPCVLIAPLISVDWTGVPSERTAPLYRGEGRLEVNGAWNCKNHAELIACFRKNGFHTRKGEDRFSGTIPEQILQQGYVEQNTVSLTESFEVACEYATYGKKRRSGVVFTIDRTLLRGNGEVYDSYGSMRKYLDWFFKNEFETLSKVVSILGVADGGAFLDRCDRETRELVESGRDSFVPPPDWSEYFERDGWERLCRAGIVVDHLTSLYDAFRGFWLYALGQVASVDTIALDAGGGEPRVATKSVEPLGYYYAFLKVEDRLLKVRANAVEDYKRNPGWQTTPFGYVAKTCRDQEFFSTGHVLGDCITEAAMVVWDEQNRAFITPGL